MEVVIIVLVTLISSMVLFELVGLLKEYLNSLVKKDNTSDSHKAYNKFMKKGCFNCGSKNFYYGNPDHVRCLECFTIYRPNHTSKKMEGYDIVDLREPRK